MDRPTALRRSFLNAPILVPRGVGSPPVGIHAPGRRWPVRWLRVLSHAITLLFIAAFWLSLWALAATLPETPFVAE